MVWNCGIRQCTDSVICLTFSCYSWWQGIKKHLRRRNVYESDECLSAFTETKKKRNLLFGYKDTFSASSITLLWSFLFAFFFLQIESHGLLSCFNSYLAPGGLLDIDNSIHCSLCLKCQIKANRCVAFLSNFSFSTWLWPVNGSEENGHILVSK